MPRVKNQTVTEKITSLQTKINNHKTQIANLEKRKTALQKEVSNEAITELANFIERKHLTVGDVKRIVNQSLPKATPKAPRKKTSNEVRA